jgi:hypothetical protein
MACQRSTSVLFASVSLRRSLMDLITVEKAYTCGTTLSSLLNSVIKLGHNVDGLLFGHFHSKSQQAYQDDESGVHMNMLWTWYITCSIIS